MEENQSDQPLSSEELLKQARRGLGEGGAPQPPPADFSIESYPPPTPEPREDAGSATMGPSTWEMDTPASTADPSGWAAPADVPAEPPPASGDWAPPPSQPEPDWMATTPGPAPTPVRRGGSSIFSKLWIVVVLVVGGFALFSFLDSSKTVDEIAVGDCLNIPEDDVFYEVDPIDCSEPHELEVFALVDLSTVSTDFSVGSPYPGDTVVSDAAFEECLNHFEQYIGAPWESSVFYADVFTPTLEGWNEVDDRIANCLVFEVNAAQTDIVPRTGSVRYAGR